MALTDEEKKETARVRSREWYAANKEKAKASYKKWCEVNKDYHKNYHADNRDKRNLQQRNRRASDPKNQRDNCRRWKLANPEYVKLANKKYRSSPVGKKMLKKRDSRVRAELRDQYVRTLLAKQCEMNPADVPQDLIKLKRELLNLYRLTKEKT